MRGKIVTFDDFRGGVNAQASPYDVEANQARDARNVTAGLHGRLRKRNGTITTATPPVALTSIFGSGILDPAVDATRYLLGSSGPNLYSIDPSGVVSAIATGLAALPGDTWEWVRAPAIGGQGPYYGSNGSVAQQWTGATASTPAATWSAVTGTVPVGRYLLYHGNRVWVAGVTADPSALFFSNIGDPRDWPVANIVRFDPADGEPITGIGTAGPYVLVFKRSKIWLVTDLDTGANRPVSRNIGCVAHRTISETPMGTFFLSPLDGVMVANQNNTQLLSNNERVSDAVIDLVLGREFNTAAAIFHDGHYYLSMQGGASALIFDFDFRHRSWWLHHLVDATSAQWTPRQMTLRPRSDGVPELIGTRDSIAQVVRMFVAGQTTDSGSAFTAYWHGPFHTFGKPSIRKRCREIRVDGSGTVSILVGKDYATAMTSKGSGFTGSDPIEEAQIYTPGVARAWSIGFSSAASPSFTVESYAMAMQERTD